MQFAEFDALAAERTPVQVQLREQRLHVGRDEAVTARDAGVAAAEGAQLVAERNVHVERGAQRRPRVRARTRDMLDPLRLVGVASQYGTVG